MEGKSIFGENIKLKLFNELKQDQEQKKDLIQTKQTTLQHIPMNAAFKMGYGVKKYECQDSLCHAELGKGIALLAIYDGHGKSGKEASQASNDYVQTYFERHYSKFKDLQSDQDRENFIRNAFETTEQKLKDSGIDYSKSGTCSIVCFIQNNKCCTANIGDSKAILFRQTDKEQIAIELSSDHKPSRLDEKERILKQGGKIEDLIKDGYSIGDTCEGREITRSLGDFGLRNIGITSEPEFSNVELTVQDKFIVLGSDGLWDVMSSQEVAGFVKEQLENDIYGESLVDSLMEECRGRWDNINKLRNEKKKENKEETQENQKGEDLSLQPFGCDDITLIIVRLTFDEE